MKCDTERLALYLHDDLNQAEREACEVHLRCCPECADTMAQYRGMAGGLAALVAETAGPGITARRPPLRRPVRQVAAAVAAVLLLGLLATQGPAIAAQVRSIFTVLLITERPQAELVPAPGRDLPVQPRRVVVTEEQAVAAKGAPLLQLGYLPEGYQLSQITLLGSTILREYVEPATGAMVTLATQPAPPEGQVYEREKPAGSVRQVKVGDLDGIAVTGRWLQQGGQQPVWWPEGGSILIFLKGDRLVTLDPIGPAVPGVPPLPLEELVSIGASLR